MRRTVAQQGAAVVVRFTPPTPWASPTSKVVSPSGATLETPSPVVDSVSTTVASGSNTRSAFVVASASGIARGAVYQLTDPAWGAVSFEVAKIEGSTVHVIEPMTRRS